MAGGFLVYAGNSGPSSRVDHDQYAALYSAILSSISVGAFALSSFSSNQRKKRFFAWCGCGFWGLAVAAMMAAVVLYNMHHHGGRIAGYVAAGFWVVVMLGMAVVAACG